MRRWQGSKVNTSDKTLVEMICVCKGAKHSNNKKRLTLISRVLTNISEGGNTKKGSKFANKWGQAWN